MKKLIYPIIFLVFLVLVIEIINPRIIPYLAMGLLTAILLKS